MLRRVIDRFTHALKTLKMADVLAAVTDTPSTCTSNAAKRELDGAGEGNDSEAKKQRTEPKPMQGRLDRKRKVAMLMAYSGAGYHGMQINSGFATIESELCKALVLADLIPQEHSDNMSKMSFQRAARTDKGVSALGQVVSLKITLDKDDVVGEINKHLPDQIRVLAIKRTTKSFNSKNFCGGRSYIYLLPTYAFAPVEKFIDAEYRVTDEIIDRVNEVLQNFKGTHNFHNYTSGIKHNDPSAKRYMVSLECGKPFVRENVEFVIVRIKGQSFMMHHIRKMIGVMISIVRGYAGPELLEKTWGMEKVDIPKAPGLGLMLERLHYDGYNKKFGSDGMHEKLDWSIYQAEIDEFSEKYVFSNIVKTEKEERSMFQWLTTLPNHSFDVREVGEVTPAYAAQRKILRAQDEAAANQLPDAASDGVIKVDVEKLSDSMDVTTNSNGNQNEPKVAIQNSEQDSVIEDQELQKHEVS